MAPRQAPATARQGRGSTIAFSPALRELALGARERVEAQLERCELCGAAIAPQHRHVIDASSGELKCTCRACALLFDRDGAGGGHLRAVGSRRFALDGLSLDDARWAALGIPVEMAFFVRSSRDGHVRAVYPSPAGAMQASLDAAAWWDELVADNEPLKTIDDDVQALLVDRVRGRRRQWIVPIDDAYRLITIVRTHWRGITGGSALWRELDDFLAELDRSARRILIHSDREETRWPS